MKNATETTVPLSRSDMVLLAGLHRHLFHRAQTVDDWISTMAWDGDAVPTFDQVSFGLPRLIAAGLAIVERDREGRLHIRGTKKANDLLKRAAKWRLYRGEMASRLEAIVKPGPEDRSLGRFPGLDETEWVHEYQAWKRDFEYSWEHPAFPFSWMFAVLNWKIRRSQTGYQPPPTDAGAPDDL